VGSDAVDLAGLRVRVMGKGAKERSLPVGDLSAAALSRYLDEARPLLAFGEETER
jgi:site-specific recombinase XerD